MEAWKGRNYFNIEGQTFRSLDSIIISSACKLRRVFTMKNPLFEAHEEQEDSLY
jgi:hypothetical protein